MARGPKPGDPDPGRRWIPVLVLVLGAGVLVGIVSIWTWANAGRRDVVDGLPRRAVVSEGSIVDALGDVDRRGNVPADDRWDLVELHGARLLQDVEVTLRLAAPLPEGVRGDELSVEFVVPVTPPEVAESATAIVVVNTPDGAWAASVRGARNQDNLTVPLEPPSIDGATITVRVPIDLLPPSDQWSFLAVSRVTLAGDEAGDDAGWSDALPDDPRRAPRDEWLLLGR